MSYAENNLLTKEDKEEIDNLKPGFNIVHESKDPFILTANRVEISRKWSKTLLNISFWLNIITIICFLIAAIFVYFKPQPDFYASTPSGKIFGPLKKMEIK
jgi:hypothetical protein